MTFIYNIIRRKYSPRDHVTSCGLTFTRIISGLKIMHLWRFFLKRGLTSLTTFCRLQHDFIRGVNTFSIRGHRGSISGLSVSLMNEKGRALDVEQRMNHCPVFQSEEKSRGCIRAVRPSVCPYDRMVVSDNHMTSRVVM